MYKKQICILYVDDNTSITNHHISYLNEKGLYVLHAKTLDQAEQLASLYKDNIDIVLLDIMFDLSGDVLLSLSEDEISLANSGKFFGFVVFKRLQEISTKFQYIILTVRKDVKEKANKMGITNILYKPIRPLSVHSKILEVYSK